MGKFSDNTKKINWLPFFAMAMGLAFGLILLIVLAPLASGTIRVLVSLFGGLICFFAMEGYMLYIQGERDD